jgi:hypothetical protein
LLFEGEGAMDRLTTLPLGSIFSTVVTVSVAWLLTFPTPARAQAQGENAVYNSAGSCNTQSPCAGSLAIIDASVFVSKQLPDICSVLNYILQKIDQPPIYPNGAVIDARGISGSAVLTCSGNPWVGIANPPPSTILLPATTAAAPIVISTTWNLPMNTHLVGQGDNISSGTIIQACSTSSCFTGSAMIQFGSSTACSSACGTAVENLLLDGSNTGNGQTLNGIVNSQFQDLSYVDHVSLYRIIGTGLSVSGTANNSGPYTNITFNTGTASAAYTARPKSGVTAVIVASPAAGWFLRSVLAI